MEIFHSFDKLPKQFECFKFRNISFLYIILECSQWTVLHKNKNLLVFKLISIVFHHICILQQRVSLQLIDYCLIGLVFVQDLNRHHMILVNRVGFTDSSVSSRLELAVRIEAIVIVYFLVSFGERRVVHLAMELLHLWSAY